MTTSGGLHYGFRMFISMVANFRKKSWVKGAVLLMASLLSVYELFIDSLPSQFSVIFLGLTLVLFGLPHGALDHRIEAHDINDWAFLKFLRSYLVKIGMVIMVWLLAPSAGFLGFLLFAAYHFGETDLRAPAFRANPAPWIITLYGIGVVGCLLTSGMSETLYVLTFLSSTFAVNTEIHHLLIHYQLGLWFAFFILTVALSCFVYFKSPAEAVVKLNLAWPSVLLVILYPLPLLTAFSIYFGLWHSLHALGHIRSHLQWSVKQLIVEALPLSLISIGSLTLVLIGVWLGQGSPVLIAIVFISALTAPHAGVMKGMYDKIQRSTKNILVKL